MDKRPLIVALSIVFTLNLLFPVMLRHELRDIYYMGINKHLAAPGDEIRLFCANPRDYGSLYVVFGIKESADCPRSFFSLGYWGTSVPFDRKLMPDVIVVEALACRSYIEIAVPSSATSGFVGVATPRDIDERNRVFVNPAKGWMVVENENQD